MTSPTVRSTVALPRELWEAVDQAVAEGAAKSRNELLALAIRRLLAERQRAAIDAGFTGMGEDAAYNAEVAILEAGFDRSSWEMLLRAEADRA